MNIIRANPVKNGVKVTGDAPDAAPRGVSIGHRYYYIEVELAKEIGRQTELWLERQRLTEEWGAAAAASGTLDFIKDDPLPDDYEE